MSHKLSPGETAPQFALQDARGDTVSLADFSGQRVILYFYPRAATPGCTTQACDFRDRLDAFTTEGFAVVGISPDHPDALRRFTDAEGLTFPLLSDPDHRVAEAYGAWGVKQNYGKSYEGLIRSTVVVAADGRVELAQYNVRATGHVARLRRNLGLQS